MRLFLYIIEMFLGAAYIMFAVDNFSRKRYFCFGLDVMLAISMAALAIKLMLTH